MTVTKHSQNAHNKTSMAIIVWHKRKNIMKTNRLADPNNEGKELLEVTDDAQN